MNQGVDLTRALAVDAQSLEQLKLQAKRNPNQAVAAVTKQFEALFLGMVMKSMREATPSNGLFDNDQTRLYTQLLDQQLAQHMATRGTGLAAALTRQLSKNVAAEAVTSPISSVSDGLGTDLNAAVSGFVPGPRLQRALRELDGAAIDTKPYIPAPLPAPPVAIAPPVKDSPAVTGGVLDKTRAFVNRVWDHAVDAARSLGVQPHFMVGQAALESGWGRHEIKNSDGTTSYNLFGIKAGRGWNGPVVERSTTEYVNGVAQTNKEKFRVYGSYAECFRDYAGLLRNNPRYSNVVGCAEDAQAFARGLQQAGYATDPAYGDKLLRIINGSTLRRSLLG